MRQVLKILISFSILSAGSLAVAVDKLDDEASVLAPQPKLGYGYSTEWDTPLRNVCISVSDKPDTGSEREGSILLDRRWASNEFRNYFNLNFKVKVGRGPFRATSNNNFYYESIENAHTESLTYYNRIRLEDHFYAPGPDGQTLNQFGQNLLGNPKVFKEKCGDRYVSGMERGADLFLQLKLTFYNRQDKANFKSSNSLRFTPMVQVTAVIEKELSNLLDLGEISIVALQRGGDAQELSKIFNSPPGEPLPIPTCRFDRMEECQKIISNLFRYASNTFPEQLKDPNFVKILDISTDNYVGFLPGGENPAELPKVPEHVKKSRSEIAKKYDSNAKDLALVKHLEGIVISVPHLNQLEKIAIVLGDNDSFLNQAMNVCFEEFDRCEQEKQRAFDFMDDEERQIERKYLDLRDERWKFRFYSAPGQPQDIYLQLNSIENNVEVYTMQRKINGQLFERGVGRMWRDGSRHFVIETISEKGNKYLFAGEFLTDGNTGSVKMNLVHIQGLNQVLTAMGNVEIVKETRGDSL